MVEGDCGNEVVADVCADDVVEQMSVDESKITVNRGSSSTSESPGLVVVVRHRGIRVLEESDGN